MKKNSLFFILITFLLLPFMADAKEYCKVVSGNGKDIGSEIACGTEHFYIIDSNEEKVKMLAKYNLNVGISIYKEKLEEGQTCTDIAISKGGTLKSDGFYSGEGYCYFVLNIQTDKVLQNEEAKSAHWDENNNYLYPQVGDVYYDVSDWISFSNFFSYGTTNDDSYYDINDSPINNTKFYNFDFKLEKYNDSMPLINYNSMGYPYGIINSLGHYKSELTNMNFDIDTISLLSISELNEVVNKISNKSLPLIDWSNNYEIITQRNNNGYNTITNDEISFGSLKQYIPKDYDWLYSTSYWNRTIFRDEGSWGNIYFVFTSGLGKICGAGFPTCAPGTTIGTGIRPVITIPANELQYLIQTKTDGNGTIEVVENALGNETIQFKATSKKGYKLKSIVITTDSGEKVEFKEGDIIKNDDGTYSIDKSVFTMPFENVTIEAKWSLDIMNPKTGKNFIILLTSMLLLITGTIICRKRRVS